MRDSDLVNSGFHRNPAIGCDTNAIECQDAAGTISNLVFSIGRKVVFGDRTRQTQRDPTANMHIHIIATATQGYPQRLFLHRGPDRLSGHCPGSVDVLIEERGGYL